MSVQVLREEGNVTTEDPVVCDVEYHCGIENSKSS